MRCDKASLVKVREFLKIQRMPMPHMVGWVSADKQPCRRLTYIPYRPIISSSLALIFGKGYAQSAYFIYQKVGLSPFSSQECYL